MGKERTADLWGLYTQMLRTRIFEEAVQKLWEEGLVQAEMHMGIGEEALMAALFSQLAEQDAIAVDHRGTAPFLLKGVDPVALLLEILGHPRGICGGMGGHMHLFSQAHKAASSGIVGSAGPAACGFGLAAKYRKTGGIAVAFFGEGAMNQGMLLESMNLAAAWGLPVLFICKNNGWAIATKSESVTGGNLTERARGLGLHAVEINGLDAGGAWGALHQVIPLVRKKSEPYFVNAAVTHKEGHFLGDPLLRFYKSTKQMLGDTTGPLMKSVTKRKGAGLIQRTSSVASVLSLVSQSHAQLKDSHDPLVAIIRQLGGEKGRLLQIEEEITQEVNQTVMQALEIYRGEN